MVVLDGDNEVDSGVGKGLEDFRVGVVDFDLVDECRLEELSYFLWRWEVISERPIVYADTRNVMEEAEMDEEDEEKELAAGNHGASAFAFWVWSSNTRAQQRFKGCPGYSYIKEMAVLN